MITRTPTPPPEYRRHEPMVLANLGSVTGDVLEDYAVSFSESISDGPSCSEARHTLRDLGAVICCGNERVQWGLCGLVAATCLRWFA